MFDISFTGETANDEGMTFHLGIMKLHATEVGFSASFSFWSEREYQRQWLGGAERLLELDSHSAFITDMDDPATAFAIQWWPAWRIGDLVILHRQLLFIGARPEEDTFNPLAAKFSLEDPYAAVGDRDSGHTEECQRTNICRRSKLGSREVDGEVCCSEWCVDLKAIQDFLKRGTADWT
jgi:hypothetical protein